MADLTDSELLTYSLAANALRGIPSDERAAHAAAASKVGRGYLAVRFEVPEDWTPGADFKEAIAAIAAASLLGRRGYAPSTPGATGDPVRARHDAAIAWFRAITAGETRPANADGLTERRGPLVAGTGQSGWSGWRRPRVCT